MNRAPSEVRTVVQRLHPVAAKFGEAIWMISNGGVDRVEDSRGLTIGERHEQVGSLVGEFVRFDSGDHCGVLRVIVADVIDDLVVVLEAEIAIRAGMRLVMVHGFISSHLGEPE